jgi:hypothetical protein
LSWLPEGSKKEEGPNKVERGSEKGDEAEESNT